MTPLLFFQTDLREIGESTFPTESKSKYEVPKQGLVLQIQKIIRNVAAPKANQDSKFAPRLLKIQFTDGEKQFSGIELENLSLLSIRDTKPGTKLYFKPGKVIQIAQDLLLLKANYFDVLGGHVQEMVDKWEVAQRYSKYSMGIRALTQAPPWIAFGQKIDRKSLNVNKKSLAGGGAGGGDKNDGEDEKEDAAFENQRKEAIAEAQKLEPKQRVFLDGAKKIVHHNVQKIVDKGFSEEMAKEALKYTRNDLSKAMANLKRGSAEGDDDGDGRFRNYSGRGGRGGGRGGRRGGRFGGGGRDDDDEEFMARPSEKISLFDFIGDKLPPEVKNAKPVAITPAAPVHSAPGGFNRQPSYGENRNNKFSHPSSHHEGGKRFDSRDTNNFRGNPRHATSNRHQDRPPHNGSTTHPRGGGHQPHNARSNNNNNNPPLPPPAHQQQHHRNERNNHQQQSHQPNSYQRNNQSQGPNNLTRDMERMSLSNNNSDHNPRQQQYPSNAPPTITHQAQQNPRNHHQKQDRFNNNNSANNFPAIGGSNKSRPSGTPGFLTKESNEAAKKFLEQQNLQPQPTLSQSGPQFQQNHRGPPKQFQPSASNFPPIGDDSKSTWNWKLGDRCLAKYWEDGQVSGEEEEIEW